MLACSTIPDIKALKYPLYASPKIDGIRCYIDENGVPKSRTSKPIPNAHVNSILSKLSVAGLDGELWLPGRFNKVQSAIMSTGGAPEFKYLVFDYWKSLEGFSKRLEKLESLDVYNNGVIELVTQVLVESPEQLEDWFETWLEEGYEGAMVRAVNGPYKYGRSTLNQGYLLKLKIFNDDEGIITGFNELVHLDGTLGDTLGALEVQYRGSTFYLGTGFNDSTRQSMWQQRPALLGKRVTFKYQELSPLGIPRFPVFKGVRYD